MGDDKLTITARTVTIHPAKGPQWVFFRNGSFLNCFG